VPYILSNANLLLQAGEFASALSLFKLARDHVKLGHCAYYGIGRCLAGLGHLELATRAYARAFVLGERAYIATAWTENLLARGLHSEAEWRALEFVQKFASQPTAVEALRKLYETSLEVPPAVAADLGPPGRGAPETSGEH
jgi:tetratricopeptide (TPR) repeat protein